MPIRNQKKYIKIKDEKNANENRRIKKKSVFKIQRKKIANGACAAATRTVNIEKLLKNAGVGFSAFYYAFRIKNNTENKG